LISWVLAAAVVAALGSDAHASKYAPPSSGTSATSTTFKPPIRPFSGEPDTPQNPLPPKLVPLTSTSGTGGSNLSVWALQNIWAIGVLLVNRPTLIPKKRTGGPRFSRGLGRIGSNRRCRPPGL